MTSKPTAARAVALVALAAAVIAMASASAVRAQAPKPKVLVVWGGWAGHEPKQTVDVFVPWLTAEGFDVEVSNSLAAYLDAEKMKRGIRWAARMPGAGGDPVPTNPYRPR